jgi:DNA-binding beta-propeller fold protein YncE
VNAGDTLYVADAFLNRITLFDSQGVSLATFGSPGGTEGQFRNPQDLVIDENGDVYVADSGNQRIQRFHRDGSFAEALGDSGSAPGQLLVPSGLALTPSRQLYVADHGNRVILQFDNRVILQFDWSSSPPRFLGILGDGDLSLQGPTDVAVDAQGFLYVADFLGNEVVQLQPDGREVRRFRGTGGVGELPTPLGIVVDGEVLQVTDVLNGKVEAFDLMGRRLYEWPAGGIPGPSRMAFDSTRRLFLSSGQDRVVFLFQLPLPVTSPTWSAVKHRFR